MQITNVKLGIGVPLSNSSIPVEFFESYLQLRKPVQHVFFRAGGYKGIDSMRNQLVNAAFSYNCTHLLFLDVDHRHHPDTITKLLSHNLPIVSGLSYMRTPPYEPCLFKGVINKYKTVTDWEPNSLIEVDSVGGACLLVNMEVFNNIKSPYFSFMKNPDPNVKFEIGEDVYFCNQAKVAGYNIYVDTSCENKHIGRAEVDGKYSQIWQKGEELID